MDNYEGKTLTPSVAVKLITELFNGQTVQKQVIITGVDEEYKKRGGLPSISVSHHPVTHALSKMKKKGLVKNPERGVWYILPNAESTTGINPLDSFLNWSKRFKQGEYVFRGVPNEDWGIEASAFRRPLEKERDFEKFLQINKELIRDAKLRGHGEKDGRQLKPLEILAELQHFNAATCLIDFTYSAQVALWFACEPYPKKIDDNNSKSEHKSKNGKVYAVRNLPPRFKEITPTLLEEDDITIFLKDEVDSQLYSWQPTQQNHRIIAQQSVFLFGVYEFEADDEYIIDADNKQDILIELQKISGISEDKLFPDFEGFARIRGVETPYTELTASAYKDSAFLAYDRGEYENAVNDCDVAIEKNPNYDEAYNLRGQAKVHLQLQEEALVDFDEAIRLNSEYAEAFYNRAKIKNSLGEYGQSLSDFDEVIRLKSDYAEAFLGKGVAQSNLGQFVEAIVSFDIAIGLNPDYGEAFYNRGLTKYHLDRNVEAIEDFSQAIRCAPNSSGAYGLRGIIQNRVENYVLAIADLDKSINLDENVGHSYYERALAKFNLRRYKEALSDLKLALEIAKQENKDELLYHILDLQSDIESRTAGVSKDE